MTTGSNPNATSSLAFFRESPCANSGLPVQAVHTIVNKAAVIAVEELTAQMKGKSFGKHVNHRF
jgi:hypothetical protein